MLKVELNRIGPDDFQWTLYTDDKSFETCSLCGEPINRIGYYCEVSSRVYCSTCNNERGPPCENLSKLQNKEHIHRKVIILIKSE